ncbi:MAG: cobalamin biosynthesis protein [Minwuiales bacterium]|nr:cobalamin biosynthesis protein [Minwuiales bacterium]
MIVAGVGYRSSASADDIDAVVRRAMAEASVPAIDGLAVPAFKETDIAVASRVAAGFGVRLMRMDDADLTKAAAGCVTAMSHAMPGSGTASVAEAAALAAAGPGARLLLARIADARAACALATDGVDR